MIRKFEDECAWVVKYKGPMKHEEVLVIAPDAEKAIQKATNYQRNYAVIKDWPIVFLQRQSDTII